MPHILSVSHAFPEHYYSQHTLSEGLRKLWIKRDLNVDVFDRIQKNVQVQGRYLAYPLEDYYQFQNLQQSNQAWIKAALDLGQKTLASLFKKSSLSPQDISLFASTTVTGIAVPSLEARLMNVFPFNPHLKRLPLFGLGCLAGVAGISRVADYLKGNPGDAALLLSVELCSLTIQKDDLSIANIVSSGLFGDGAAGVLMVGEQHPLAAQSKAKIIAYQSVFFPDSEHVMGWDVMETGFKIVLSSGVPKFAEKELEPFVKKVLKKHQLTLKDIHHWVAHPGGPKVIKAMEKGLKLPSDALAITKKSLETLGNLSSSSVLIILEETIKQRHPKSGEYGVMLSMGPGFSAEMVLLQWK
ncbi:3-oxoacyl-[acyl-carrier-protein] synthase III C-terminal domain-containing protein [Deltaproteobacteria bacterium TL4]